MPWAASCEGRTACGPRVKGAHHEEAAINVEMSDCSQTWQPAGAQSGREEAPPVRAWGGVTVDGACSYLFGNQRTGLAKTGPLSEICADLGRPG